MVYVAPTPIHNLYLLKLAVIRVLPRCELFTVNDELINLFANFFLYLSTPAPLRVSVDRRRSQLCLNLDAPGIINARHVQSPGHANKSVSQEGGWGNPSSLPSDQAHS